MYIYYVYVWLYNITLSPFGLKRMENSRTAHSIGYFALFNFISAFTVFYALPTFTSFDRIFGKFAVLCFYNKVTSCTRRRIGLFPKIYSSLLALIYYVLSLQSYLKNRNVSDFSCLQV